MSLDGGFLHLIKCELIKNNLIGARVDKIHQPASDEVVITFRSLGGSPKLLLSANTVCARVCLTNRPSDNPKSPPMFCMLLRKHLSGGRLIDITQDGLERIVNFDFYCMNEIGDMVTNRVAIEIMGRSSNIMLLSLTENGYKVIDSIKRVTDDISSVRRILPGILYVLPPREKRICLLDFTEKEVTSTVELYGKQRLAKALISTFEGISPLFARECAYYVARDVDVTFDDLTDTQKVRFIYFLKQAQLALNDNPIFTIISEKNGKPKDFAYINVEQYGTEMVTSTIETASQLLEVFFGERATADRMKQRSNDLLKHILTIYERISHKIDLQETDLLKCKERDTYRICGDLISANIYKIEKGMKTVEIDNYLTGKTEMLPLDVRLSPSQNAQKQYLMYRKLDTADKMLTKLIADNKNELLYIDSVFDETARATNESELTEIRQELHQTDYIKNTSTKKEQKPLPPMQFVTKKGINILVGRNNIQNDKLTLKTAKPFEMWFHVHNMPGSHTILCSENPSDEDILEAAEVAAYCSKCRDSTKVPVDYTKVKFVKKPGGAKPGMVIFTNNKTILVEPKLPNK